MGKIQDTESFLFLYNNIVSEFKYLNRYTIKMAIRKSRQNLILQKYIFILNITTLDLSDSKIDFQLVDVYIFNKIKYLRNLNISSNHIKEYPILKLNYLNYINISNNNIININDYCFYSCQPKIIDLSNNCIQSFICKNVEFYKIILTNNNIKFLNIHSKIIIK